MTKDLLDLASHWFQLYLLLVIPGFLVGWLLRRFCTWMPAILAVGIAAEMLTLAPAAWDFAQLVWKGPLLAGWSGEMTEGLLLLHIYLFVPVLLAVSTGYFGAGVITNRVTTRTQTSP